MRIFYWLVLSLLLAFQPANAQELKDRYQAECAITPADASTSYPGASRISNSNKLAQPTGKAVAAEGQQVYFYGRLFDENCVPLKDAEIELWQANPYGKYRYASMEELATPDPVFAGAGRTYTDNVGEFAFITLFPGGYGNHAPHVHLRISHPDIRTRTVTVFFAGDNRNDNDPTLKRIRPLLRDRVLAHIEPRADGNDTEPMQAHIDITVPGKQAYRQY